jgi:hypothetical protein
MLNPKRFGVLTVLSRRSKNGSFVFVPGIEWCWWVLGVDKGKEKDCWCWCLPKRGKGE